LYTPDDGHRWDPGSLCTYAAQQSYHNTCLTNTQLIHILPLYLSDYMAQIVSVIAVLEMSWFIFFIQTCDLFHQVIKVTTEFCSPPKFSKLLPFVCCPQLHILLFPQCKPPIPVKKREKCLLIDTFIYNIGMHNTVSKSSKLPVSSYIQAIIRPIHPSTQALQPMQVLGRLE
jgi:hypothetical protein